MHKHWKGALRDDYRTADRKWDFSAPMWHTGQAIKALVLASRALEDDQYVVGARFRPISSAPSAIPTGAARISV